MKDKYIRDVLFSLITFFLLMVAVNILLYPEMPGFIEITPHPYLIVVLLIAGRFGLKEALMAAVIACVLLGGYIISDSGPFFQWSLFLGKNTLMTFASFFAAALIVGEMRNFNKSYERGLLRENQELKAERVKLHEQLEIVTEIKEELENRILGQEETVHSLYQATKALETLEEKEFFDALPKLTARFTGATKVSLYMVDYTNDCIRLVSRYGWNGVTEHEQKIPLYQDIFGIVMQQNYLLTIKEISDHPDQLQIWEQSRYRAYAYVPIAMSSVIVGILTVDDIPFLKLNVSTVRILSLIAELAVPALKNIISYQDLQEMVKIDPVTDLLKYDSFLSLSEVEFKKAMRYNLDLSLLAIEIQGLLDVEAEYDHDTRIQILKDTARSISKTMRNVDVCGLGPREGQILITLPVTNTEGALTVIDRLKQLGRKLNREWNLRVPIQFAYGAASYHPSIPDVEKMVELALNSLEMSKKSKMQEMETILGQDDGLESLS